MIKIPKFSLRKQSFFKWPFLRNEPGEQTLAQDIMSLNVVFLHPSDTYRKAVELLTENRLTVLPVVSQSGKFLGLLTEQDVLRAGIGSEHSPPNFLDDPIQFKKIIQTILPNTPFKKISSLLSYKSFRHIPVVDKDHMLQGIITRRDLIRILYFRIELKNSQGQLREI